LLSDAPSPWQTGAHTTPPQRRKEPRDDSPIPAPELRAIAEECSQTERRADDAERELMEWKKIKFMQDRVGEDFDAMITSCTRFGFFVELEELFMEGLVPMGSLTDDFYTYRENTRQIVGNRTGQSYRMGQKVRVLLDRVDRQQRRLQFAVLPPEGEQRAAKRPEKHPPKANGGKRRRKERNQKAKAQGRRHRGR
jgi:ribonuclease R